MQASFGIARPRAEGGRRRGGAAAPPAVRAGGQIEGQGAAARERAPGGPGPARGAAVEAQARYVGGAGGAEGDAVLLLPLAPGFPRRSGDRQPAAVGEGDRDVAEERAADREDADARHLGVEPEGAEDVPGRERAEVVVAGVAGGRGAVEAEAAAHRRLGAVGAAQPVIEPGRLQGRLVAEQGVVGVGAAGAGVELAQEAAEALGGLPGPPMRAEEPGRVVGDHPGVLGGVALDEAAAATGCRIGLERRRFRNAARSCGCGGRRACASCLNAA